MADFSFLPNRSMPFYLSGASSCPYLEGRVERKLFSQLAGDPSTDQELNTILTRAGFRRSHDIVYRPACPSCKACVPVRIPVNLFKMSRNLRRVAAYNDDLSFYQEGAQTTDEQYELFMTYQQTRHPGGEMASMSRDDFTNMVGAGDLDTHIYEMRDDIGRLMGAVVADHVGDGISAVYSFFRAGEEWRSLGIHLILSLIQAARAKKKPYLYLGYWISSVSKMAYKARFQPLQRLAAQGWTTFNPKEINRGDQG